MPGTTAPRPSQQKPRHFSAGRMALFILIVGCWVALDGMRKMPTGAAAGDALNGPHPTPHGSGRIRIATFNMNGGAEQSDDKVNLDLTADTLKGFDLEGLQEVHGIDWFKWHNQAEILGQKLNQAWLFAPVETQWWHDAFGNGVLTNLPVDHWQRFPLSNAGADTNRNLVFLRINLAGRDVNVLVTHLERHDDHARELASVVTLFLALQPPAIAMGDFNIEHDDPQIAALRKEPGVIDPIGDLLETRKKQLAYDRIFARGFSAITCGYVDKGASDHPLAWAELQLKPLTEAKTAPASPTRP